jgi:energy-converting hydrogenase Eha subunit H
MTPQKEVEFENKINALCMSNARIEAVLLGDEMGSIGMAQRMINNEKKIEIVDSKIENHEKKCDARNNQIKGVVWIAGILWTVGIFIIGYVVK